MRIKVDIAIQNQQYTFEDIHGVVELGRETTATQPNIQHCQIRDPYVSKHHLRVQQIDPSNQIAIENISRRARIEVNIVGVGRLEVGEQRVLPLPVELRVGQFSRIQITADDQLPASMDDNEDLTYIASPEASKVDPFQVVQMFEDLDQAQTIIARAPQRPAADAESKVPSDEVVRWLQTLAGVNRSSISAEQFYKRSARAMVDLFGMDSGLVLRRHAEGWEQLASYPRPEAEYSATVLREVMAKRSTYIKTDRLESSQSLAGLESAVASPIFGDQQHIVAVLYAARRREQGRTPRAISALEARLVQVLATAVGAGLSALESRARLERMETELDLARQIQASFFPRTMPELPDYELCGQARPADAVGGDYFDVISLPDGKLGLVIADVCGHGVGPSLLMASLRATLRGLAHHSEDAAQTVTVLNEMLYDELHAQRKFVTLLFGLLDPAEQSFRYANAGHGPVVLHLRSSQQSFRMLHEDPHKNLPVGMFPGIEYQLCEPVQLQPHDLIVLGSDGVVEINESYGLEHLQQSLLQLSDQPIDQLVKQVLQAPLNTAGRRRDDDDMTLLVARRKGAPHIV